MINARNDWEVIEAAYMALGGNNDDAVDPGTIGDYDLRDAVDQTAYEITGGESPEIALLVAFARNGYLDNDEIWEEIGNAAARALAAYAEERWEEAERERQAEEDWDEDEDW